MKLELGWQSFGAAETAEVNDSLSSGMVTMGKKVARFEAMFAEYVGAKHAVMVNSGSSANLLAVSAMVELRHWSRGARIKVPAMTWATTLWPIVQGGLTAELLDVNPKTLQTPVPERASFATHILGNAVQERADLEDCCEALGVYINGHHVGSKAMAATFSFYMSHHITTVEGGMVTTYDAEIADCIRSMRSHGWTRGTRQEGMSINGLDPRFTFVREGYNLRPTEFQAGFGIHQLPMLEKWNEHRRNVYAEMRSRLEPLGLFQFMEQTPGSKWAPFAFPVLVNHGKKNALSRHLEGCGIQTRPILAGNLAAHPAVRVHPQIGWNGVLKDADRVNTDGIYWGCHPGVDDAQIEYLVQAVESFLSKKEAA